MLTWGTRITCRSKGAVHSRNWATWGFRRGYQSTKIGVQSIPFAYGQYKKGVELGPEVIRKTGFMEYLRGIGVEVMDYGAIDFSQMPADDGNILRNDYTNLRNTTQVGRGNKLISDSVVKILQEGCQCINLGGDHSIGIGTVHGCSEYFDDLAVLWVDAHCDINTPASTLTGNYHGMTLAFLVQELQSYMTKIEEFAWITPRIKAKNLVYLGIRDVDPYEREIFNKFNITTYSTKEIDRLGIMKVMEMIQDKICDGGKRPLHLSFDIDALNDTEVPATIMPTPGGLSLREAVTVVEEIRNCGNLVSMDLVEINPLLAASQKEIDRTATVGKEILINCFGHYRGGVSTSSLPSPNLVVPATAVKPNF